MCVWTGEASLEINLSKASSGESKDHGLKLNKLPVKGRMHQSNGHISQ